MTAFSKEVQRDNCCVLMTHEDANGKMEYLKYVQSGSFSAKGSKALNEYLQNPHYNVN